MFIIKIENSVEGFPGAGTLQESRESRRSMGRHKIEQEKGGW